MIEKIYKIDKIKLILTYILWILVLASLQFINNILIAPLIISIILISRIYREQIIAKDIFTNTLFNKIFQVIDLQFLTTEKKLKEDIKLKSKTKKILNPRQVEMKDIEKNKLSIIIYPFINTYDTLISEFDRISVGDFENIKSLIIHIIMVYLISLIILYIAKISLIEYIIFYSIPASIIYYFIEDKYKKE